MDKVITVVDLGNSHIKAVVLGEEEGKITTLAKSSKITKGLRNGKVLDKEAIKEAIHETIKECSKRVGEEYIDEIVLGISHPQMKTMRIQEQKRILEAEITNDDIQHLSRIITDSSQTPNYDILKIIPTHWIINEISYTSNPLGASGKKLDLVADAFLVPHNFFRVINEIIDELDIFVVDIIPTMLGTAESTLTFDSKDLGSLCIDMGKSQTSYAIYENGQPLYYNTLPIGGDAVTKDISIGLQIDLHEAESTKINYGQLLQAGQEQGEAGTVTDQFLADIITARYEEILTLIQRDLKRLDKDGRLPGGVRITGGASKITGLTILAKSIFKVSTSLGTDHTETSEELQSNQTFINSLGLYQWSKKYSVQPSKSRGLRINADIFKRMKKMLGNIF